jgi:hypothetical protein
MNFLKAGTIAPTVFHPHAQGLSDTDPGRKRMLLNWDALAPVTIFTDKYYEETKYSCWHILRE